MMANNNKFIPFYDSYQEPTTYSEKEKNNELLNDVIFKHAARLSVESGKLLEASLENSKNAKSILKKIQSEVTELLLYLDRAQDENVPYTGTQKIYSGNTSSDYTYNNFEITNRERHLDNGGLKPPKEWKSITEINLDKSQKHSLVQEMRKLNEQGLTINKSSYHHKPPVSIQDFTEPFKFVEYTDDYNGSFLINLLKSEIEIENNAATFQVDLNSVKNACINNDSIILTVYDITGSPSNGEEKKFLLIINFDKTNGTLKFSHAVFMNGKYYSFSHRQLAEIEKFCKAKKINYDTSKNNSR